MCDLYERDLARKLAAKWHRNAQERRSLPGSGLAGSLLVAAIRDILQVSEWYPPDWPPDEPSYDGVVITPSDGGFTIHERREIGVMQFSEARVTHVATLEAAVHAFLEATFKGDVIDGIAIDWTR